MTESVGEAVFEGVLVLLFWPGISVALISIAVGVILRYPKLIAIGALLATPFSLVMSSYSELVHFIPILTLVSAYLSYRNQNVLSGVVVLPIYIFVGWLVFSVIHQPKIGIGNIK